MKVSRHSRARCSDDPSRLGVKLGFVFGVNQVVELGLKANRLFELDILRVTHLDDETFRPCKSSRYGLDASYGGRHFTTTSGRLWHVRHFSGTGEDGATPEESCATHHRAGKKP